ncbi:Predicted arabinose efflux permease, MFS family [Colwellia chukchiensis]|uniref:Predicted arabinose efflux permease, MFS family n=1 Tax=Colwellia chukchiensis TaxID=641665 RepID=A0A1H7SLE6_9GAMM|nr:MFS transporter [Colwellia chukchiensis]SEL72257.1 Predicted arabinose efflux permease, MFS family [Colwellia chukchiensis]
MPMVTTFPMQQLKVAPNGVIARIILAFLTTAGIFYINIMPAVVNGLKEGLAFSSQQAGFVSSANLYGAAIGALLAVFIIKHIRWQRWCYLLLIALIAIDTGCIFITEPMTMIAFRAMHGLTGGLLVGIGFGIISRTLEADKTFGYLLLIQWGLGGLGIMYLPGLVPEYGTSALFVSLATFTVVTLLMMPFLPDYAVEKSVTPKAEVSITTPKLARLPLLLNLAAIFLFQAANMGLFAYMISLGKADGLSLDFMSNALGVASWVALLGALLVIVIGTKYGRMIPVVLAIFLTAFCSWGLHFSSNEIVYLIANITIGITWAFVLPYLFGICSELDESGQMAALGGVASKMGLASGPMVAALLLSGENYQQVINVAVIGLVICALLVFKPASALDRH